MSSVPMPSLPGAHEDLLPIRFRVDESYEFWQGHLIHSFVEKDGEITLEVFGQPEGNDYRLFLPDGGNFFVTADLQTVVCMPEPAASMQTIEHLLLDQVIPRVLAQSGRLVFHGSCVVLPTGRVVTFLGDSGVGKSVLAASIHKVGGTLLTDDCFMVVFEDNVPMVVPGYSGLRLWPDMADELFPDHQRSGMAHYSAKQRVSLESPAGVPKVSELGAVYLLDKNTSGQASFDSPSSVAMRLLSATFLLDIRDPKCHRRLLELIEQLVRSGVRIESLHYARNAEGTAEVLGRLSGL